MKIFKELYFMKRLSIVSDLINGLKIKGKGGQLGLSQINELFSLPKGNEKKQANKGTSPQRVPLLSNQTITAQVRLIHSVV